MRWLRARLAAGRPDSGMTLVELLVAAAMSVMIVGAAGSMLISAVRSQPDISERAQAVSTARYVLERLTREIRSGVRVDEATGSRVSFVGKVRRTTCGGATSLASTQPARECQIVYDCSSGTACTRTEREKGSVSGGVTRPLIGDLDGGEVFNYSPSAEEPTYVGINLRFPNPSGEGDLTVSDGASMRTPTLLTAG
jgi:type II secretory pathway pseudopilin PulG